MHLDIEIGHNPVWKPLPDNDKFTRFIINDDGCFAFFEEPLGPTRIEIRELSPNQYFELVNSFEHFINLLTPTLDLVGFDMPDPCIYRYSFLDMQDRNLYLDPKDMNDYSVEILKDIISSLYNQEICDMIFKNFTK